jgi:hypothetical protein
MENELKAPRLLVVTAIGVLTISGLSNISFGQGTTGMTVSTQGPRDVTGLPYMADEFTETTEILRDGNRITHKSMTKVFRDGEGRTRREVYRINSQGVPDDSPNYVDIFDPVTGVSYDLNPRTQTAQKREDRVATSRKSANPTGPTAQQRNVQARPESIRQERQSESLGSQVIEGLNAEGKRYTTVYPAGAIGNEQPLEIVTEVWISTELHIPLLHKSDDPRRGQTVTQVTNIRRDEPSPDLFQVPPDYTVEEMRPTVPVSQAKPADNE